ncbi:protein TRM32-like [Gastrolobium bilobum]|uniref:protein TRM32-like n=1 Tax=Gastrolobium bilobum TaxID=150636 RepID=UPI002AB054F8|nr:protein TRM32-like [Gastrolobium bilobum]
MKFEISIIISISFPNFEGCYTYIGFAALNGHDIPGTSDDSGIDNMPKHHRPYTKLSNVEEKLINCSPATKHSIKSRIKAFLPEEIYRKKGRHKRSSTCPVKSQLTRVDSVHHLEVDPLSELLLTVESPEPVLETFQNHLAAGTLDVLSPVFSEKPITNHDKCVDCGTMFSSDNLEHCKTHKHHKQCTDTKNLSSSDQGVPEEKLMNAKILTTDASPHLFKDFLDALDVINTNKDFLLKYIQDPGSPLPFNIHNQPSFGSKSRRAKSISFPVSGSSSGSKDPEPGQLINKMVDDWFNAKGEETQLQLQSQMQNVSMSQSSGSSQKVDQFLNQEKEWTKRDSNSSTVSSQVPNHVKAKHFKDFRKKLKHIIEESKNEKHRITKDAILDKIPHGNRLSKNVRKYIHDKSKDPTINEEGKDSATSGYGTRFSNSFNKRQLSAMRTSSLKESVGRYSQLYETCFNSEVKFPKIDSLRLRTEERSSILKTPKSFKRFLSLPNLKSYFQQSEEPPVLLSPQDSIRKYGDRTTNTSVTDQQRRIGANEDSESQILPPTLADNTNQESTLNADKKQLFLRSASKSGLNVDDEAKADKIIGIDGLENLRDSGQPVCNEQDAGPATESATMLVEANSVFSSDSFLDDTFEFETLNELEETISELKPGPDDGLDNMAEQQEEVVENGENFQNLGTLSKRFNYEIPCIEVDTSNEAAFNYVRKVLELSSFTGNQSLGIWYSDDQPVDPSVYEELEGCLLLDPDCSGNCDEGGQCNHLLLFDIINEGLLEIFGRSYNYYPRPLSSLCHVHPLPAGDNVLHKVWTLISWYLNSTSEVYPSLDYYVSRDLAKNDGWMNLQFDSEFVGLELDDFIFYDLLEEIICT